MKQTTPFLTGLSHLQFGSQRRAMLERLRAQSEQWQAEHAEEVVREGLFVRALAGVVPRFLGEADGVVAVSFQPSCMAGG